MHSRYHAISFGVLLGLVVTLVAILHFQIWRITQVECWDISTQAICAESVQVQLSSLTGQPLLWHDHHSNITQVLASTNTHTLDNYQLSFPNTLKIQLAPQSDIFILKDQTQSFVLSQSDLTQVDQAFTIDHSTAALPFVITSNQNVLDQVQNNSQYHSDLWNFLVQLSNWESPQLTLSSVTLDDPRFAQLTTDQTASLPIFVLSQSHPHLLTKLESTALHYLDHSRKEEIISLDLRFKLPVMKTNFEPIASISAQTEDQN